MKVNEEILAKANEVLDAEAYEKKCLKAKICPLCGNKLQVQIRDYGDFSPFKDDIYTCACGYKKTVCGWW